MAGADPVSIGLALGELDPSGTRGAQPANGPVKRALYPSEIEAKATPGYEQFAPNYAQKRVRWDQTRREEIEEVLEGAGERVAPVLLNKRVQAYTSTPYEEQPWHRHAAYYYATGMSCKDVAKMCDCSVETIYTLCRRPQFQAVVTAILEANGQNDIMARFKAEFDNSFVTLVELRDNPNVSPKVRADIAIRILEQTAGKPKQVVENVDGPKGDPMEEMKRLEADILRMKGLAGVTEVQATVSGEAATGPSAGEASTSFFEGITEVQAEAPPQPPI